MNDNAIRLTERSLIVEPLGLNKLWSFTRQIQVPWEHVRGATHDSGVKYEGKGWRGPGLWGGLRIRSSWFKR